MQPGIRPVVRRSLVTVSVVARATAGPWGFSDLKARAATASRLRVHSRQRRVLPVLIQLPKRAAQPLAFAEHGSPEKSRRAQQVLRRHLGSASIGCAVRLSRQGPGANGGLQLAEVAATGLALARKPVRGS